jgi:hypothetical protein
VIILLVVLMTRLPPAAQTHAFLAVNPFSLDTVTVPSEAPAAVAEATRVLVAGL